MERVEGRIVLAAIAIFIALGGIAAAIRGLLYEDGALVRIGALAMVLGVAGFVILLNPWANK
ncbi:hypothetical protein BTH42_13340 [Burkholderia sp. SRS-W-2-2016]|uniref:DUF2964 family protein n=1 Tax=Burkholderia sp. SRS-W-2-2016 TaxID=1926878 RepID=UPI00094B2F02|nr:DUF2964 family protein [Burkholderia sp. SRS-W-2-2016]OLL31185.1 hypothetical protein BTH42_13340 [Burkholderia sp. SRS-W-2-2016]